MTTYDDIKSCAGTTGCYGVVVGPRKPTVFEFPPKPHLMVITEQPKADGDRLWKGVEAESLKGIPDALNNLFDGSFYKGIKNKGIYWTHFIKCPGKIRRKRREGEKLNKDACANKFLAKEIEELRPDMIITFGGNASRFVLDMTPLKTGWREQLWKEVEAVASDRAEEFQPPVVNGARLLVFMHPSPASPLGYFLPKLKSLLKLYVQEDLP